METFDREIFESAISKVVVGGIIDGIVRPYLVQFYYQDGRMDAVDLSGK